MAAPQVPDDADFRFQALVRTRWSDEDMQGVLNNAVYATLCEEARFKYFRQLELVGPERHFPFVLMQSNIRFLAPGHGPAEVQVGVRTVRLGSRSFRQAYRIREVESGQAWAEAEAILVLWDPETRGSAWIPENFRKAVAELEGLEA